MSEFPLHPVPAAFKASAHIDAAGYEAMYQRSVTDPEGFWADMAEQFLQWDQPWESVSRGDFRKGEASWFAGRYVSV